MPTWKELENDFRELSSQMTDVRVDVQWGAAGEHLHLVACNNRNLEKRFYALSTIAGQKLISIRHKMSGVDKDVMNENNPIHCWFKGIWKISGNFKFAFVAEQQSNEGKSAGFIYTGSIYNIAEAASVFCLELSSQFPETEDISPANGSEFEDAENDEGGWIKKILKASNLKPEIFGISIDLKKLFSRKKVK